MKRIVVASKNPVKARAALNGFRRVFPEETFEVETVSVASGVSDQPLSDDETLRGARNRARAAMERVPDADAWVGLEGGVEERPEGLASYAWIVVLSRGQEGRAQTGVFFLPDRVADLVRSGTELGHAIDEVFERSGSKRSGGAVGVLTDGAMDRTELYEHAVVLALVPFRRPELYGQVGDDRLPGR